MFGSKNMFSKMLLLLVTFIHILSKSFSLSSYISVSNAEYPVVMPSSSVNHKRTGVQERECFSGRLCEYRISESDFLCKVQTYVISKKAKRFLPKWLWFNEEKRTLFGIPSEKDQGICDILIIGLTKILNHSAGHICGSVTIKITVWGLNSFPLFAQNSLLRVKIRGNSDGQINTCAFNEPIVLASLVLSSNILDLNGEKRCRFIEAFSSSYDISVQNMFVLPNTIQNPFLNLLESSHVVASGPGANRSASGSSMLLTWHVKCGVIQLDHPLFEQLKQLSQKWSRTKDISYGVIGWHVIIGFQNHYVKHAVLRRRRNVIGGSTTLVHSTIPISRATIVTTKLKPSKTSYSQTATLTRRLPSPTFSSPVGSSSLFNVFSSSSTQQLNQINSSSSQYSIGNSSLGVLPSRNLSMISPFSSSAKLRTSIQPSSTSTQIQRSTTYILLPSSIHLISPSGYGTASNELFSSTAFTTKTTIISSFLRSRDTSNATSFTMRSSSNISRLIASTFLKTTLHPSVISSNSTFKTLDTAIVSTPALNKSTELLSFTKKYLLSRTSALQQSRTYFTSSQDFVLRTTSLISGIAEDTTILVKTINQSRSESSSSTIRPTQPPSIISTHVLLASTQSYDRTASNLIYSVDFGSTPILHTDIGSTTSMLNKTSQVPQTPLFRSSVIYQTNTVVSLQPYSTTPGVVDITSSASRTMLTSTIDKQQETATRQLVTYSSKLNLYSSANDTTIQKGSLVTSTQSMSAGFSLQTSVKDGTTFSKPLIQTSRKTFQFQTTLLSTSSKYMVSNFIQTTAATRFVPVQTSSTPSGSQTKEISSLLTSMKDKATLSKTLIQTSSKTLQSKISGTTTAASFKPVQLSSTSVNRRTEISSSRAVTVSRALTDTMSATNFSETTFVFSMPTSVVKPTSLGLTTLFVASKMAPSTIELSMATAETSRSPFNNSTTLRILPTSSTPLLSPSLTNYFNTAILTLPTEQLTSTPSFSYFIKEPSSTPLVTPTSVQTNTGMRNQASVTFNEFASSTVIRNQTFGHSYTTSEVFEASLMSMVHTNLILSLPSTLLSSLSKQMISSTTAITNNFTSTIPFSTSTSFGTLVSSISSSKVSSSLFSLSYRSSFTVSSLSLLQSFLSVGSTFTSSLSAPLLLPSTHQASYYKNSMTASFSVSSSVETDVIQSPLLSVSSSSAQRVIVRSASSPPSSLFESLVLSGSSLLSFPPSPFQSAIVSASLFPPPSPSPFQSVILSGSSLSSFPPSSMQSVVVFGSLLSPPSSSFQSMVVPSSFSPPPSSSLFQSVVVSGLSSSLPPRSLLQSVVVSGLSSSLPPRSLLQSVVVSGLSSSLPLSSSLQSVIVSSPSQSPLSSSLQSVIVSSPSPSPPSSSSQSVIVSSPSPSPPSSSLQSVIVSSPSPSPSSNSLQSVVVSSPPPSLPSSSLQSVIVLSPSPSPSSSSLQSVVVSSPSLSPPSGSLQSPVVLSPSPSPSSSYFTYLQSVVVSRLSPSLSSPSSSFQSVVVSSSSPLPPSSSLDSVIISSPAVSPTPLSSSSLSPSRSPSSLQSVVISSPSPSDSSIPFQPSSSSSVQSVVISSPSPSYPSSPFHPTSVQSLVISSPSPSHPSSSFQPSSSSVVQSVMISSSLPQFTLLSFLWSSTVQSMSASTLRSSDQSLLDRRSLSPTTSRFFHSFVKQSSPPFTLSRSSTFYNLTLSPQVTSRLSSVAHVSMSYMLSSMYFISPSIATTHSSSIASYLLTSTNPAVTSSDFSFSSVLSAASPRSSSFSTTVPDTTSITEIKSQTSISEPDIALRSSSASPSSSSIMPFPTTPPKNSPKLYNSFDLLVVTVGKVFNVQIPIDTFHDREDGNTRNLFLSCLDGNHGPLSRSSWLQFNTTTQTLYGVVLASQVEQIKTSSEYLLVAKDRDGNKAYDAFTIDIRNNEETLAVSFSVRIMGTSIEMFNQDLSNMLLLVQKIADYYGDKDESLIRVMSVKGGSVVVTWGNATVQTCNEDLINELTLRIVTAEGNIQPGFYNTLLPTFLAEDVYRNRTGPCILPITTEDPGVARISSYDDSAWLKYFLPGLAVAPLIIIGAVIFFLVRRHSGVKILKEDKRTFKRRKPIILDDELEMSTLSGKPIELPDDSPTPVRYPKETALTNPVYDGSDEEDFPEWSSPILPAPSYQRRPPRYGSSGDYCGYNTPPPPYKLPPSY